MVCSGETNETNAFYWSGEQCVECSGQRESGVAVSVLVLVGGVILVVSQLFGVNAKIATTTKKIIQRKFPATSISIKKVVKRFEESNLQTKYKILVTFVQILTKVTTLYPLNLPDSFTSLWLHLNSWNPFVLDLNVLPFNCIVETSFHSRLLLMTIGPIAGVVLAVIYYILQLHVFMRGASLLERNAWLSSCTRFTILFILTIFRR
jgi:heme/copper-type cytochrome/quinol oxidase subunit 4